MNRVYVATGLDGSQQLLTARQAREIMTADDVPSEMVARKLLNLDVYGADGARLDWLVKGEVAHA